MSSAVGQGDRDGWLQRHRFSTLFATLAVLYIVAPQLQEVGSARFVTLLSVLALGGAVVAISHRPEVVRRFFFASIPVFALLVWRAVSPQTDGVELVCSSLLAAFFLFSAVAILRYVLVVQHVDVETILGALCVYLLVALVFSHVFALIYHLNPDAFRFAAERDGEAPWLYYSMVTLTTLGYGDIAPMSAAARMLSVLEAAMGQLYLAVLVARVVGLHVGSAQRD